MKRMLALLLSLVMLLTLIPAAAAEDIEIIDPEQEPVGVGALDDPEQEPAGVGVLDDPLTDPADEIAVVDPEALAEQPAEEPAAEPEDEPAGAPTSNATIASGDCGAIYEWYSETEYKRYDVKWVLTSDGVLTISGAGRMGWDGDCPWSDYRANITSVVIKSGVTFITGFSGCTRLKSVTIPAAVTGLGWNCFSGCSTLKSVRLPNGVTSIPGYCFSDCSALTSVTIPSGVTVIDDQAFARCRALTELTLPTGLQSIGDRAFFGCSALTDITIPAKVTGIGNEAFASCAALTEISVASGNPNYCSAGGVLFNKNKTALIAYPGGKSGDYTIPSSVYVLSPYAFEGCQKLGHLTVGSHVTVIPSWCFYEATLAGITLPDTLEAIEGAAFYECRGLSSITIPASVDSIGALAFSDCNDLHTISFLGDAPDFGDYALLLYGLQAFYPANASGWDKAIADISSYNSRITWQTYKKPAVTTQPKKVTAYPGGTASFTAAADTYVTYQWYYRKSADSAWTKCSGSSATTDTLQISVKSYHNGYQYRCKMTNPLGSVTSHYASLTVSAPKITTQPADKTTTIGATVSFTVKAAGASSYQWQFSKDAGATWSNCSNGTSASLSVTVKNYHHGYQYRCQVTNAMGTVCSDAATLSLSKPTVTKDPKNVKASPDETVTFTVTANNAASYQWYFRKTETGSWSKCSNGTSASLAVEVKAYRHGYQYRCAVKNAAGTVYSNAATLRVKPGITTRPTDKTASSGETVTFTVKATGASSYQWYYRKTPTGSWNKCTDGASATLTVEAKSYRSGFQYRCKVTNEVGSVYTNAVTLTVH